MLADKNNKKYRDQVWAGLIDDPETLAQERTRRAAEDAATQERRKTLAQRVEALERGAR